MDLLHSSLNDLIDSHPDVIFHPKQKIVNNQRYYSLSYLSNLDDTLDKIFQLNMLQSHKINFSFYKERNLIQLDIYTNISPKLIDITSTIRILCLEDNDRYGRENIQLLNKIKNSQEKPDIISKELVKRTEYINNRYDQFRKYIEYTKSMDMPPPLVEISENINKKYFLITTESLSFRKTVEFVGLIVHHKTLIEQLGNVDSVRINLNFLEKTSFPSFIWDKVLSESARKIKRIVKQNRFLSKDFHEEICHKQRLCKLADMLKDTFPFYTPHIKNKYITDNVEQCFSLNENKLKICFKDQEEQIDLCKNILSSGRFITDV